MVLRCIVKVGAAPGAPSNVDPWEKYAAAVVVLPGVVGEFWQAQEATRGDVGER
jgi:hypothetical protein